MQPKTEEMKTVIKYVVDGIELQYKNNHNSYLNANKILELILWEMNLSIGEFDTSSTLAVSVSSTLRYLNSPAFRFGVKNFLLAAKKLFPKIAAFKFALGLLGIEG